MKTSVRNFIASLFIGATAINANAETITTGSVMNTNNQEVITYTVHHPSCANTSNGSIDIDVTNGATYSFSWDNGMNAEDINGLGAGTYRVRIETNEGEVLFASFDDISLFDFVKPNIISVSQPVEQIGIEAANLALQLIDDKDNNSSVKKIVLPTSIISRI